MLTDAMKAPTDSLYKFMAIGGLALASTSIAGPATMWWAVNNGATALLEAQAQYDADHNVWDGLHKLQNNELEMIQRFENDLVRSMNELDAKATPDAKAEKAKLEPEWERLLQRLEKLGAQLRENMQRGADVDRQRDVIEAKIQNFERLLRAFKLVLYGFWIPTAFGIVLSAIGFRLWYVRDQAFRDQALKTAAETGKAR